MPPRIQTEHPNTPPRQIPHLLRETRKAQPRVPRAMMEHNYTSVPIRGRRGVVYPVVEMGGRDRDLEGLSEVRGG
jgi:hypothetical protein